MKAIICKEVSDKMEKKHKLEEVVGNQTINSKLSMILNRTEKKKDMKNYFTMSGISSKG